MAERSWHDDYRYGFNGKENDDEVKGGGNSYDFGARIYDPRLARFLVPDKFDFIAPFNSSYSFASNSPIMARDAQGDSTWVTITQTEQRLDNGEVVVTKNMVIHMTIAVLDLTGRVSHPGGGCSGRINDVGRLADGIESGFNAQTATYKRQVSMADGTTRTTNENISFQVEARGVKSMDEVLTTEHLLVVVDDVLGKADLSMCKVEIPAQMTTEFRFQLTTHM